MRLTQDDQGQRFIVRSFSDDHVVVNDQSWTQAFILTPEQAKPAPVDTLAGVDASARDWLLEDNPEVVIIATGQNTRMGDARLNSLLMQQGVGIEYMDLGAACRTFTVLSSEYRRVSLLVFFEHSFA